jgi:hypothetical protein
MRHWQPGQTSSSMATLSPRYDRHDPYELERLAEELEARELVKDGRSAQVATSSIGHDLPIYVPLAHDNPHLTADVFSVEDFLLSRTYTSLHDLRSELRHYLSDLKEELVKLINDDYEAFISLSTDLKGEGARLERLKFPLATLKAQILVHRFFLVPEVCSHAASRCQKTTYGKFNALSKGSWRKGPFYGKRKYYFPHWTRKFSDWRETGRHCFTCY